MNYLVLFKSYYQKNPKVPRAIRSAPSQNHFCACTTTQYERIRKENFSPTHTFLFEFLICWQGFSSILDLGSVSALLWNAHTPVFTCTAPSAEARRKLRTPNLDFGTSKTCPILYTKSHSHTKSMKKLELQVSFLLNIKKKKKPTQRLNNNVWREGIALALQHFMQS